MPESERHDEFMQLFLEHQPRIYSYIRSLLFQKADADDVMQETAAVLWKKFDDFKAGTHFDRWALRVAFHQVRCFRQKKAREANRLQFSDTLLETLSSEAEEFSDATEDVAAALSICRRKLAESDQRILAWRFQDGATNRSVAGKVGKSESVVSRTLSRVYESLMRCINLRLNYETSLETSDGI